MKEFDFIGSLLKPIAGPASLGLADDCAFFDGYVITKDMLSSGIHFFADDEPGSLARKALRVNLSDLAASGAEPYGFMLGLSLAEDTDKKWLEEFTKGLAQDIKKYNCQLLGGDTIKGSGPLTISITAIGRAEKPIKRAGAKAAQNIFVTGSVGKGALGLVAKKIGKRDKFSEHYDMPDPRVDMIPLLRKHASAAIDISDGLLADLWHICEESGLGAEIFSEKILFADNKDDLMLQLTGGDDYEIIFTSGEEEISGAVNIGKMSAAKELKLDGKKIPPRGYEH